MGVDFLKQHFASDNFERLSARQNPGTARIRLKPYDNSGLAEINGVFVSGYAARLKQNAPVIENGIRTRWKYNEK